MPTNINFDKSLGFVRTSRVVVQSIKFPPVNVTPPAITGNITLGSFLQVISVGQWLNYPSNFTYQWARDGAIITGATESGYTLVQADSAAFITCVVTATNITGYASTPSNQIKAETFATVPVVGSAPVISGSTALSSVLTTTNGTWSNTPTSFVYQWRRGATLIGTNTNTYTLVAADSGAAITCSVTASNASGPSQPSTSNIITAQTYSTPVNSSPPVISGSTTLGSTLTSITGTFTGNPTPTYGYQWRRNAVNITSATASTYVLVSADSAAAITCVVTATNALGSSSATSNTITADTYATPFTSTWRTTAASETVTLPYEAAGTYSGTIDWGDGGATSVNSYANRTHTYAVAGDYVITVTGVTIGFRFGNTGDRTKIRSIQNWGNLRLGNNNGYFYGCTNLNLVTVTGTLDLTGTTNLSNMFFGCTSLQLVSSINSWNTASVTSMSGMFNSCSNFNQPLSFNTASVTNMSQMFYACNVFNNSVLFNTAAVTNMINMFTVCSAFNQPLNFDTASVTSFQGMFFGCSALNSLLTFTTTGVGCSAQEMFYALNSFNTAPIFTSTANITNMNRMFSACPLFNKPLTFNTNAVTNMSYMFASSSAFNSTLTFSSTANVTTMFGMFEQCNTFNQPLTFNTTAVTNMGGMFSNCTAFNSALTFTSTANVTDMNNMFRSCVAFNQPLNFNTIKVTSFSSFLRGCTNFNQAINFTTSAATNMEEMFMACPAFNSTLTLSSTAVVTNMSNMFNGATAFNQNIGSWNVANVTNFTSFMVTKTSVTFSTTNLDAIYNGWSTQSLQPNINISFGTAKYSSAGAAGKAVLVASPKTWTIIDGGQQADPFTSTWLVTAGETITLPYEAGGTYSGTIDWGDSSTSTNSYANRTHTYVGAGTYTISITGVTTGFRFNSTGSRLNIRTITNWGTLRLGNSNSYFSGCSNLTLTTVVGTLDLTGTTDFFQMFGNCFSLTTINGINSWSTGAVTSMYQMFYNCYNFNQALSFNTAAVTNMLGMFQFCSSFNSSLTFNTALVNSMNFMFFQCSQFNTAPTFSSTAAVTNMQSMFRDCANFNKALTFNTAAVTNMYQMFDNASAFNQDISGWNTISVTNMGNMFNNATAFNQNLGSWNVANVTDFAGFMATKTPATFSAANLAAIYNGWVNVQASKTISFGTAKYSAAGAAGRNYLTGTKLWTITDGGEDSNAFTSTWQVIAGETITLPYEVAGTYSGTIDWGDSTTSVNSYANRTHTYATAGTKTISITGTITGFRFAFTGSRNNIRTITNWGSLRLGNNGNYFNGCQQLTLTTVAGTLDLTGTTNLANMFDSCTLLTTVNGINSWSTGLVTNFSAMFASCSSFNQALSFSINTTSSVIMTSMFNSCGVFNSALTFNTSAVTAMNFMFYGASAFNQNIGTWNTGAVTNMQSMFNGATAFQQYLGSWNVANVTNFTSFMASKLDFTFPADYLDNIYSGWSVQSVKPNINISFGVAQYTSAGAGGKFSLQNVNNWTITDGGEGV